MFGILNSNLQNPKSKKWFHNHHVTDDVIDDVREVELHQKYNFRRTAYCIVWILIILIGNFKCGTLSFTV